MNGGGENSDELRELLCAALAEAQYQGYLKGLAACGQVLDDEGRTPEQQERHVAGVLRNIGARLRPEADLLARHVLELQRGRRPPLRSQ
jgi:hypothetical protein